MVENHTVSYRFAFSIKWILSHLFVLTMVITMINLGFWQLRRLDEKRHTNTLIENRAEQPIVTLSKVLLEQGIDVTDDVFTPQNLKSSEIEALQYRSVTIQGTYMQNAEVLVRNRSLGGAPGWWVLTPLLQDDGTVVVINRGWIPFVSGEQQQREVFTAPVGPVEVSGIIQLTQPHIRGPKDAEDGILQTLSRVDIERMAKQIEEPTYIFSVNAIDQKPDQGESGLPQFIPLPELTEGSHASYAGQWFIFTTLTLVTYPLLLRRRAKISVS